MKIAPIQNADAFGHVIAELRTFKGETQAQLAEELGVNRRYIVDFEQGKATKALLVLVDAFAHYGYVLVPTKVGENNA